MSSLCYAVGDEEAFKKDLIELLKKARRIDNNLIEQFLTSVRDGLNANPDEMAAKLVFAIQEINNKLEQVASSSSSLGKL